MKKEELASTTKFAHDGLFRKALENPIVAQEFFDLNLPSFVKDIVDTSTLKLEKESFVEEDLSYSLSDVLFSVELKNKKSKNEDKDQVNASTDIENNIDDSSNTGYIYLLSEHQSKPDPLMAFRLFKYMINICDRHLTIHHKNKQIPIIYPMIFYQGKQKYNVARNIFDISVNPELARQFWMNDYHLIDLHNIPDDELKKHDWYGSMAFLMKHIFAKDLVKVWEGLADKIPTLAKVEIGEAYVKLLLTYTLTKINQDDKVRIRDLLTKKLGNQEGEELMISVALELYNEGEAQGMKQAAINMIKQGLDTKLIEQVTGFSHEEILRLKSNN